MHYYFMYFQNNLWCLSFILFLPLKNSIKNLCFSQMFQLEIESFKVLSISINTNYDNFRGE